MLFGWDVEEEEGFCVQIGFSIGLLLGVEEEEFCFQIGFSIGVYSWGFVSCVILIPVNTHVIDRDLPGLSIDCWLFGSFFRRIFTGKIFHLLPIWLPYGFVRYVGRQIIIVNTWDDNVTLDMRARIRPADWRRAPEFAGR